MSRSTIQGVEGGREPRPALLRRIAEALHTDVASLRSGAPVRPTIARRPSSGQVETALDYLRSERAAARDPELVADLDAAISLLEARREEQREAAEYIEFRRRQA